MRPGDAVIAIVAGRSYQGTLQSRASGMLLITFERAIVVSRWTDYHGTARGEFGSWAWCYPDDVTAIHDAEERP